MLVSHNTIGILNGATPETGCRANHNIFLGCVAGALGTLENKGGSRSVLWCTRLPNAGPLEPRISDNGSYSHSLHSPRSQ